MKKKKLAKLLKRMVADGFTYGEIAEKIIKEFNPTWRFYYTKDGQELIFDISAKTEREALDKFQKKVEYQIIRYNEKL